MLFDKTNCVPCSIIGRWKFENGRDYILQEVEKIEVYNPGGRDIEVAYGYPIRLLDSCINHIHCKMD